MLAIFCDTPGQLTAKDLPQPVRGEGEVLVRIRRIGVCGTDLHIFTGNQPYLSYPRIMGHELSGTVEEAPAGSHLFRWRCGDHNSLYVLREMQCLPEG